MNIYPYNYYILYGSIGLLVLALLITLIKALKMSKSFKNMNLETSSIQDSLNNMNKKTAFINEVKEAKKKKYGWLKTAIPIAIAIRAIYNSNDDLHGLKGYKTAAQTYMKRTTQENKLIKRVNRAIIKK